MTKPGKNHPKELIKLLDKIDRPAEIAAYYGFSPIKGLEIKPEDIQSAKSIQKKELSSLYSPVEEKVAIIRSFFENNFKNLSFPVSIFYRRPLSGQKEVKPGKKHSFGLEILGSSKSINEAVIIKCAVTILEEEGFKDLEVEINSMGDKESISKFERELGNFIKKNPNLIPKEFKHLLKKDKLDLIKSQDEKLEKFQENAPKSISFLSEQSRQHFKEVLEFLETMKINYSINPRLLGEKYHSHVIFEIKGKPAIKQDKETTLALGGRYGYLSKKIGFKKDVPAIGVSLSYTSQRANAYVKKRLTEPNIRFIQLSFGAKLKSINVIEILRKSRILIDHSLTKDKIIGQVSQSDNQGITHLIIMGQKEAIENTVVVRNLDSMAQDIVKISDLPAYFKKLKNLKI